MATSPIPPPPLVTLSLPHQVHPALLCFLLPFHPTVLLLISPPPLPTTTINTGWLLAQSPQLQWKLCTQERASCQLSAARQRACLKTAFCLQKRASVCAEWPQMTELSRSNVLINTALPWYAGKYKQRDRKMHREEFLLLHFYFLTFPPLFKKKKRTLHNSPNTSSLSREHSGVLSDTHTLDISKQTGSLFGLSASQSL